MLDRRMAKIAIIGGGRWARTIAGVLAGLDASHQMQLHSRHGAADLSAWIAQKGLGAQVTVSPAPADYRTGKPDAVIVANRASDHMAAVLAALDADLPVLVEKPVAIGANNVRRLLEASAASGAMLAASHVFLFARYLEAFAKLVAEHGHARRLEMVWQDGQGDVVRGDVKSYDPAVTVFDDVLPHVLPVLAHLAQQDVTAPRATIDRGGAAVVITATAGGLPVTIRLGRNAPARNRVLAAITTDGVCTMDFSAEPGTLTAPGRPQQNGDPRWDSDPRPLGAMLAAFLQSVKEERPDERLSPQRALASALFADDLRASYREQREEWLRLHDADDAGCVYARQEISAQG
jgi:predicted dehydrogenase